VVIGCGSGGVFIQSQVFDPGLLQELSMAKDNKKSQRFFLVLF